MDLEQALEREGIPSVSNCHGKAANLLSRAVRRAGLMGNLRRSSAGPVFVSFMGLYEGTLFPFSYWTEIVPYCFDCWPSGYERWVSFFRRHRVRIAFFTARQSARYFAGAVPRMKSVWLPEATDPSMYCPSKCWPERDIDILELGRKNDRFHGKVAEPLAKAGMRHLFEQVKGRIVFPEKAGLIDGLARSKISICFPCSQTHPERSGSVETVTHRYFESMASKCVIVGHAPQELLDLFGYNPVIEVQEGSEFEQLESLLNNPDSCQHLVERNYRRLGEVGTWKNRVVEVLDHLHELAM